MPWPLFLGAASSPFGIALLLASAAAHPGFSWLHNNFSDLALSPSPLAAGLFNAAILLSAAAGLLVVSALPGAAHARAVMALGSLSLVGIVLFPENMPDIHRVFATAFFALPSLGLLLLGFDWRRHGREELGLKTMLAGALTLTGFLALAVPLKSRGLLLAIPELYEALALMTWTLYAALRLRNAGLPADRPMRP